MRLRRRRYGGEILDFGCRVWHKVPGKVRGGDLRVRWLDGVWLGTRFSTNEHVVGMPDGRVVRAKDVQSMPEEVRWDAKALKAVTGLPWLTTVTTCRNRGPEVPQKEDEPEGTKEPEIVQRGMPVKSRHLDCTYFCFIKAAFSSAECLKKIWAK